ncbi:GntR family transcriptional regulator [Streptomyces sp. ISL-43]|uniref:GntR family transcriptional regulator n=1 Tax=Streptomyces sp. ISL-43 TaxID=2819183 RepID=UPI001BE9027B|nr:GntR family transcriptional regulator [Streptomyces sp. ISL-43]MBT2446040.1 GntR family transcriptional regulator [Streptomyces sp. ISL-43]
MADTTGAPYLVVAAAFRALITSGEWAVDSRLPSRISLGEQYGVGENVIRRAQELLITEGLLEGRPGAGTYVRAPLERLRMLRCPAPGHPSAPLAPAGISTWDAQSTAKVQAPDAIAERLRIKPGALCVRTAYEFLDQDRRPVMSSTSWEPMAITGKSAVVLPDGGPLGGRSVVDRMAHLGIAVVRAVERVRPIEIDRDQAQQLGVATGTLATLIERTYLDDGDRPVETADIVIPADRWDVDYDIALVSGA